MCQFCNTKRKRSLRNLPVSVVIKRTLNLDILIGPRPFIFRFSNSEWSQRFIQNRNKQTLFCLVFDASIVCTRSCTMYGVWSTTESGSTLLINQYELCEWNQIIYVLFVNVSHKPIDPARVGLNIRLMLCSQIMMFSQDKTVFSATKNRIQTIS